MSKERAVCSSMLSFYPIFARRPPVRLNSPAERASDRKSVFSGQQAVVRAAGPRFAGGFRHGMEVYFELCNTRRRWEVWIRAYFSF